MMRRDLDLLLSNLARDLRDLRPTEITRKSRHDHVTDIDRMADRMLSAQLAALTPGVPVFSEEREIRDLPARYWIIDPIDGTANLIAGLPFVAMAAALIEDGAVILSGVADITRGVIYTAARGQGAFCGTTRLTMPITFPELLSFSSGFLDRAIDEPELLRKLRRLGKFRNLGSQALQLCAVATGALSANISMEARRWDDAAGSLIVTEAGGTYRATPTGPRATDRQRSVAAHPAIADDILNWSARLWPDIRIGDPV